MKFPKKYIQHGERILHSGDRTNIFYDVNVLLTEKIWRGYLFKKIPRSTIMLELLREERLSRLWLQEKGR